MSASRAIVEYEKHRYTTFTYRVVCVITHKMVYRIATVTRVLAHTSLILARMQL